MTKRDFLVLMIKLFGLYSAISTIFSVLPNNIIFSLDYLDAFVVIWLIAVVTISMGLFWTLTFKADKIIDVLKLGNGFTDDRIALGNIKSVDIVKIGTFIIGGLLFIKSVPGLLSNVFWAFKGEVSGLEFDGKRQFNLVVSGLNVLIGYLLLTNYDIVARRLHG